MPASDASGSISPEHYQEYAAAWVALIDSGDQDRLTQAFQLEAVQLNFLTFSIDQVSTLVSATGADTVKARFLLMPDASGQSRFTTTLFASDADNKRVSDYLVPAQSAPPPATGRGAEQAPTESTKIPRETAVRWLTAWVDAPVLLPIFFTTGHGALHGYNFELSTFADPLAAARPYEQKVLFLNLGLSTPPDMPETAQRCNLVVYIGLLDSRKQGTLTGLPDGESFYDAGSPCPPAPPLQNH